MFVLNYCLLPCGPGECRVDELLAGITLVGRLGGVGFRVCVLSCPLCRGGNPEGGRTSAPQPEDMITMSIAAIVIIIMIIIVVVVVL